MIINASEKKSIISKERYVVKEGSICQNDLNV